MPIAYYELDGPSNISTRPCTLFPFQTPDSESQCHKMNMICAKFSTSLRGQTQWSRLEPLLAASPTVRFQEMSTTSFDLAIPLRPAVDSPILHCFLAWSSQSESSLGEKITGRPPKDKSSQDHHVIVLVNDDEGDGADTQLVYHFTQLQARFDCFQLTGAGHLLSR